MTTQTMSEVFSGMESKFRADKAAGMTASFQFNITGEGAGVWHASIADGAATFGEGEIDSPNTTITVDGADWLKITSGEMNAQMAFMTGKLKVQGDLGLATKLGTLFL